MFTFVARVILKNRMLVLSIVLAISAIMAYQGQFMTVSYRFSRLLPQKDTAQADYDIFRERFGQVGNSIIITTDSINVFSQNGYEFWNKLQTKLSNVEGVASVLSPINAYNISRNDSAEKLEYYSIAFDENIASIEERGEVYNSLPFYKEFLISPDGKHPIMMVQIELDVLYKKEIMFIVDNIQDAVKQIEKEYKRDIKISGLPHLRMANTNKIKREIFLLIALALGVTSLILYLFLRSFTAMFISMVVVILGVFWSFGLIGSLGYEISMFSSLVPTIVIIIGIPNCIFLINKYHAEYKNHGNRILALQRVIRKIGAATFMTNATTAMGFAALILTESQVLKEFGVVASINIMVVFLISLVMIPVYYSFKKPPKERHYSHLEQKWISGFINFLIHAVMYNRKWVYVSLVVLLVAALIGAKQIYTTGNLSEEFRASDPLLKDLKFFEEKFGGVVPLEIVINTKKPGGAYKSSTLKRVNQLQEKLNQIPGLSRSLSITDGLKFAKQAYYRGDSNFYDLPTSQERSFIFSYLPESNESEDLGLLASLVDSSGQYVRITMQVKDMGTNESEYLKTAIATNLNEIFPKERYEVTVTGAWMVFQRGTTYLIRNLMLSLSLAITVIAIVMAIIFRSFAMVLVSLIPNIFPLIMTAGIMGYFGIPLKPSTILVFSVAFGISVDDTIHFLAKYRQELKLTKYNIGQSVLLAIRETGVSMFYTSIVLFFGFSVFVASSFGGIVALGLLVSVTLIIAMIGNLLLLPTLLLSFERLIINKSFTEPYITIYDEGEDDENEEAVIQDKP